VLVKRWVPPVAGHQTVVLKRKWLQDCLEGESSARGFGVSFVRMYHHFLPALIRSFLFLVRAAVLGAAYLTGGIALALDIGHEFRLRMGDREQWNRKDDDHSMEAVPRMLLDLQDRLGYEFRSPRLLVEALTHASFPSAVTSELGRPPPPRLLRCELEHP
jgi:hypothetical protein